MKWKKPVFLPLFTVAFFCGMFLINRCTFKKPVSPSWDVQFVVPLVGRKYTMRELAEDDKNVLIENDNVVFTIKENIEPFNLVDRLKSSGATISKTVTFGSVSDGVALPDTIVVTSAEIKKGSIRVEMRNNNNHKAHGQFRMLDMVRNGNPLTMEIDAEAFQAKTVEQFLDGYQFNTIPSQGRNYIYYTASLTGGTPGETVDIVLKVSEIVYSSLTGKLKEIQVNFSDVDADVNLPDEIEGFQIGSATAELTLQNGIPFPAQVDMNIKAINKKAETATAVVPATTIPKSPASGQKSATAITLSNMERIINLFPNRIELSGRAKLGDNTSTARVTEKDEMAGSILFKAPLVFTLPSRTNDAEVDTIKMEEDARENIRKNAEKGKLTIDLKNNLPVGFSVYVLFSKRPQDAGQSLYNVLNLPQIPEGVMVDTLILPLGTLSSGTPGVVTQPGVRSFSITLPKKEIDVFDAPEVYQGLRIVFPGTQGKMIKIRPDDYIEMHAVLEFSYRMDFEDEEKGGGS